MTPPSEDDSHEEVWGPRAHPERCDEFGGSPLTMWPVVLVTGLVAGGVVAGLAWASVRVWTWVRWSLAVVF